MWYCEWLYQPNQSTTISGVFTWKPGQFGHNPFFPLPLRKMEKQKQKAWFIGLSFLFFLFLHSSSTLPFLYFSPPFPLLLPSLSSSCSLPLLFFSPSSTFPRPFLYSSSPLSLLILSPPSSPFLNSPLSSLSLPPPSPYFLIIYSYLLFQPNQNQDHAIDSAGPSVPYAPFNVAVPAGQPVSAAFFQEVVPPELWPHNFIILSVVLAIVLGIFNVLTLPLTVIALTLAVLVILNIINNNNSNNIKNNKTGDYKTTTIVTITKILTTIIETNNSNNGNYYNCNSGNYSNRDSGNDTNRNNGN